MARIELPSHDVNTAMSLSLGTEGIERIADTAEHVGDFFAAKAINGTAVFDSKTDVHEGDPVNANDRLLEGDTIFLPFKAIQLLSGTVLAYKTIKDKNLC